MSSFALSSFIRGLGLGASALVLTACVAAPTPDDSSNGGSSAPEIVESSSSVPVASSSQSVSSSSVQVQSSSEMQMQSSEAQSSESSQAQSSSSAANSSSSVAASSSSEAMGEPPKFCDGDATQGAMDFNNANCDICHGEVDPNTGMTAGTMNAPGIDPNAGEYLLDDGTPSGLALNEYIATYMNKFGTCDSTCADNIATYIHSAANLCAADSSSSSSSFSSSSSSDNSSSAASALVLDCEVPTNQNIYGNGFDLNDVTITNNGSVNADTWTATVKFTVPVVQIYDNGSQGDADGVMIDGDVVTVTGSNLAVGQSQTFKFSGRFDGNTNAVPSCTTGFESEGGDDGNGGDGNVDTSTPPLCLYPAGPVGRGLNASACVRVAGGLAACGKVDGGLPSSFGLTQFNGGSTVENVLMAGGNGYYDAAAVVTTDGKLYFGSTGAVSANPVAASGRVVFSATGQNERCYLTEAGGSHDAFCSPQGAADATQVTGLPAGRILSMDVGYGDACAVHESGKTFCWKTSGNYVTPGAQGKYEAVEITLPKADATFVSVSEYRACVAYASGDASCFSNTAAWGFGLGEFSGQQVVDIAGGKDHTCFLTSGGDVSCAGMREDTPSPVVGLPKFTDIEAGWNSWVCGVTAAGEMACFDKGNPAGSLTTVSLPAEPEAAACVE